jgi:hypothetical protein
MAKNKKRKKAPSAHSVGKIKSAQYKNEVMEQLDYLCYLIGGEELFDLVPKKYKEAVFATRGTLRVISGYGKKIQKRMAVVMEKELREEMYNHSIEVMKGNGRLMYLSEFLTVGVPVYLLLQVE